MEFDTSFNPCAPLIVGFIIGFLGSIFPSAINEKFNQNGILFTYPHVNRFLIPSIIAVIVSAIIQACKNSQNGAFGLNRLSGRTAIMQGGWQIVGMLITIATSLIAGFIIGILYLVLSWNTSDDQFNDGFTYEELPKNAVETD
jgi:hypothetical protein